MKTLCLIKKKFLEARSKLLKKEGKGKKPNAAEALMHAVWLFNSMHFSLRGYEEHGRMTWGNVQLHLAVDGTEYLEYSKHQMKTRTGAEPRNVTAVKPKAFSTPNGPPERDPVAVYKIYSQKRPDPPYYLGINYTKSPLSNNLWSEQIEQFDENHGGKRMPFR